MSSTSAPSLVRYNGKVRYISPPAVTALSGMSAGSTDALRAAAFVRGPLQAATAAGFGILYASGAGTPTVYLYRPSDFGGWHDTYRSVYPGGIAGGIDNFGPIEYFGGYYWQGISPGSADGKQIIRIELSGSMTLTTPVTLATTTALNTAWPLHNGTTLFFVSGTFVHNSSGTIVGTISSGSIASRWRYREWDTDEKGLMMVRVGSDLQSSRDGSTWTTLTMPGSGLGSGIGFSPADSCWYVLSGAQVWKSPDEGASWSAVTPTLPLVEATPLAHLVYYEGLMLLHYRRDLGGGDRQNVVEAIHPESTASVPIWNPYGVGGGAGALMLLFNAPGRVGWMEYGDGADSISYVSPQAVIELP